MADAKITPCLWFDGKAEEAANFYVSLLPESRVETVVPGPGGKAMVVEFTLAGQPYLALNGGPYYQFSPAVSFIVNCDTQAEIDRLWAALLDGGTPMQCGWITDRYGMTWQIVPRAIAGMMKDPDREKSQRVMAAMMPMVKIDLGVLQAAYEGR
ncbi:MAG: VOC family protein [Hyphomicrobiaceae bacterium]